MSATSESAVKNETAALSPEDFIKLGELLVRYHNQIKSGTELDAPIYGIRMTCALTRDLFTGLYRHVEWSQAQALEAGLQLDR